MTKYKKLKSMAMVSAFALMMAYPVEQARAQVETIDVALDIQTLTIGTASVDMDLGTFLVVHDGADDIIVRTSTVGVQTFPDPAVTSVFSQTDAPSITPGSVTVTVAPDIDQNVPLDFTIDGFDDGDFDGVGGLDIPPTPATSLRLSMTTGNAIDIGGNNGANQQVEWNNGAIAGTCETDLDGGFVLAFGLDVLIDAQPLNGPKTASFDITFAF